MRNLKLHRPLSRTRIIPADVRQGEAFPAKSIAKKNMAPLTGGLRAWRPYRSSPRSSACAAGQDKPAETEQKADSNDKKATAAKGEIVSELGKSVMYVFQAKNNDYWFGSNDRGVYRYDGKTLVNFTTKDGLVSNRIRGIQEDRSGNIYFTTYEGISKFDGRPSRR